TSPLHHSCSPMIHSWVTERNKPTHTDTPAHTPAHTHRDTPAHTQTHSLFHTHTHTHAVSQTLSFTHTHAVSHTHSFTHTHTHTCSLTHSFILSTQKHHTTLRS